MAVTVPVLTAIDVSAAGLHRQNITWRCVWVLCPTSVLGMLLGQWLTRFLTDAAARLLVGSILLTMLGLQSLQPPQPRPAADPGPGDEPGAPSAMVVQRTPAERDSDRKLASNPHLGWPAAVGLVGGCATMLTNSMGPLLNLYLLSVEKLSPISFIGTRAMFFVFINLIKLPLRIADGSVRADMLGLCTLLGVVAVIGVFLAKLVMAAIPAKLFIRLELGIVGLAGLRLLYGGLGKLCPTQPQDPSQGICSVLRAPEITMIGLVFAMAACVWGVVARQRKETLSAAGWA